MTVMDIACFSMIERILTVAIIWTLGFGVILFAIKASRLRERLSHLEKSQSLILSDLEPETITRPE